MINVYQCELLLALKPAKYRTDSASTALGIGAKQAQALPHWCERPLLSNADVHRGLTWSFLCVCVWRAEDNLRESLLPFYHVGPAGTKLSALQKVNHFTRWASLQAHKSF